METIKKLFYDIKQEQYYVLYRSPGKDLFFKVDQANPVMISREIEHAMFLTKHERDKVIEEMEEFVKNEFERLSDNF
ncbi:hypothetical protein N6B72_05205 [Chryseobacterium soli]|uniref:hypothetical protein n=1 Tax=Chryseobacterium soli TaxID=445961 RepID=UPI00295595C9|nr:hypothetical protein [Chryseobacterium soli]MDV7696313.1 hypothetical protein [Chryseobacterium soli]